MTRKILIVTILCVSSIAQGQPSGETEASADGGLPSDVHRMARTAQLIVKLKDAGAVTTMGSSASASASASAMADRTAEIEGVIARVKRKRLQDRTLQTFGAAAQTAPGAADDPAADVQVKRIMTQGEHVLRMAHPMTTTEAVALAAAFAADPAVAYAEPDLLMFPQRMPSGNRYTYQWGFQSGAGGARFDKAWEKTVGSDNEVVAVIDSGVRHHRNFAGRLLPGYDFISDPNKANHTRGRNPDATDPGDWLTLEEVSDPRSPYYGCAKDALGKPVARDSSWHGTHVAGTIGAAPHYLPGGAGGTWRGFVLPVRVLGKCGGSMSDIVDGMRWAAGLHVDGAPDNQHPAKVINMSLGGFSPFGCSEAFKDAISAINARGATVVVAAGNSGFDARLVAPASCKGVVTVAAHDPHGQKAWFSNFGPAVHLSAPGVNIWSTSDMGRQHHRADFYKAQNGTSMAAPHVAAAIALMRSVNPTLTPERVKTLLERSARPFPSDSTCIGKCGGGMLDAEAAVEAAEREHVAM